jgi:hypothetical protein
MKQEVTMKMRFFQINAKGGRESHDIMVSWVKLCDSGTFLLCYYMF